MKSALLSEAAFRSVAVQIVAFDIIFYSKTLVWDNFFARNLADFSSEIRLSFLCGGFLVSLLEIIPEKEGLVVVRMLNLELFLIE